MNELMKYLKTKSLEDLETELSISIKKDSHFGLTSLKYSQVDSPTKHPVVADCRGIVLNQNNEVMALPFKRFHNLGDNDIVSGSHVSNKLDGSLCTLYYNDAVGMWFFATSNSSTSRNSNLSRSSKLDSFVQIYELYFTGNYSEVVYEEGQPTLDPEHFTKVMQKINSVIKPRLKGLEDYSFIFELTSPYNKVIVDYNQTKMNLIGVRNRKSGEDLSFPEMELIADDTGFEMVKYTTVENIGDVESYIEELRSSGIFIEGVIIRSPDGVRHKYKTKAYVAAHFMDGERKLRKKDVLNLVIEHEEVEFLTYYPEYRQEIMELVSKRNECIEEYNNTLQEAVGKVEQGATPKEIANSLSPLYRKLVLPVALGKVKPDMKRILWQMMG